jgi:hypothetical protein
VSQEDEYFHKLDQEAKNRLKEAQDARDREEALARRKALHANKCGRCGGDMHPRAFRGVEIDVCGECNAVLLDPGELEQLADRDRGGFATNFFESFRRK